MTIQCQDMRFCDTSEVLTNAGDENVVATFDLGLGKSCSALFYGLVGMNE